MGFCLKNNGEAIKKKKKRKMVFSGEVTLYIKGCAEFKKPEGATYKVFTKKKETDER